MSDEVDRVIGSLAPDDQPRRSRKKAAMKIAEEPEPRSEREEDEEKDEEEEEDEDEDSSPADFLPRDLPKPAETARSLGGLMTKYQIGDTPEFSAQLHRLLPKFFPGGVQAHGYLEEFRQPISEEYISAEYGGGTYQIKIFGPDPKNPPNGVRQYDSIKIEISGAPNPDRLSRSVRAKVDAAAPVVGPPANAGVVVHQENPAIVTQVLKMANDQAMAEREDRRRAEKQAEEAAAKQRLMFDPLVEAERRRGDELLKAERERAASERQALEERIRDQREEMKRLAERVESMQSGPQRSLAEEVSALAPLFKGDGEAAAAAAKASEAITQSILDKHRAEIESLHKQQQTMLESLRSSQSQEIATMRTAHASEVAALRDAAARELAAERESMRLREQRHEETLKVEREERRRDAELWKKTEAERDKQWRDRMEDQELRLKALWESRVETQKTNLEAQLNWLRSELEQYQARVRNFESQIADRGDIVKQLSSLRDLRSVARDALGVEDAPAPSGGGGIGLSGDSGGGGGWKELVETAIENVPAILQQWNAMGGPQGQMQQQLPQQQQQQPTPQVGQVVNTPQGPMVVVIDPQTGQPALAPKDQYDAYMAQQRTSRPAVGAGPRPRGMFATPKPKPSSGLPVPDMSIGLPKPRPLGEPVQPPLPDAAAQAQAQPQRQQQAPQPVQPQNRPQQGNMDQTKKLIAGEVAKLVHKSVEEGDEPEEFVQKILSGGYPEMIVKTIAGMSDEEVISGIKTVQPNSAGATPLGQRFVRAALAALRASI